MRKMKTLLIVLRNPFEAVRAALAAFIVQLNKQIEADQALVQARISLTKLTIEMSRKNRLRAMAERSRQLAAHCRKMEASYLATAEALEQEAEKHNTEGRKEAQ